MEMQGVALYVCDTDSTRTKKYPFRNPADAPARIKDTATGDTFTLVMRSYEVDRDELDAQAARMRAWNARLFGGKAA